MGDIVESDFAAPAQNELPQGANEFIQAHGALYGAIEQLFLPYLDRHAGIARNFEQVMIRMREVGMWTQDAINMMLNPKMFEQPAPEAADGGKE